MTVATLAGLAADLASCMAMVERSPRGSVMYPSDEFPAAAASLLITYGELIRTLSAPEEASGADGITAEWVIGYFPSDVADEVKRTVLDAFAEFAALNPAPPTSGQDLFAQCYAKLAKAVGSAGYHINTKDGEMYLTPKPTPADESVADVGSHEPPTASGPYA